MSIDISPKTTRRLIYKKHYFFMLLIIKKLTEYKWCSGISKTSAPLRGSKAKSNTKSITRVASATSVRKLLSTKWKSSRLRLLSIRNQNLPREHGKNFSASSLLSITLSKKWIGRWKWFSLKFAYSIREFPHAWSAKKEKLYPWSWSRIKKNWMDLR